MKLRFLTSLLLIMAVLTGCDKEPEVINVTGGTTEDGGKTDPSPTPDPGSDFVLPESNPDAVNYADLYDPVKDAGQFYLPEPKIKPELYWYMVYQDYGGREDPGRTGVETGLQNYLLMQSIAGLVNRACAEGKTNIGIWIEAGGRGYKAEQDELDGTTRQIGRQTALELATKEYGTWNGYPVTVKHLFDGYVLTDLVRNPESGNVATVASHVYNSIIVDVRDSAYFNAAGYKMKYDCSKMTLQQAFDSFKDQCSNDCLVVMPVKCGELRDYAIMNNLFILNLNKQWENPGSGQNVELFDQVLDWLKPNSQVLGWEQGVGEDVFVDRVSRHGHLMLAADWSYNENITSRFYKSRQSNERFKSINPRSIDYGKKKNFYSFFLTDGDNYQYIITDNFEDNYYCIPSSSSTKIAIEIGTQSLTQLMPTRLPYLVQKQPSPECTIMETFGGGYFYVDTYSTTGTSASHRAENLKILAQRTAAHMRQHGIKVLHVMAKDLASTKTKEALQAFVDANDQLEGITAVQYSPYTGGSGKIIWLTNKAGYDIPCITAKYMIWQGQTTPAGVADSMKAYETAEQSFSTVCVHAWSEFDERKAGDAAAMCKSALSSNPKFQAVSMQELIWRLRMAERKDQTLKYLATIK